MRRWRGRSEPLAPGRDLKPITAPGFPLRFFLAMHDAGVVRFVINPVAVDTRERRVAS